MIANARLSERSAKGYAKLGGFMRRLLSRITLIAAQNEEDGNRFLSLGLKRNQLAVTGSLKFDISVSARAGGPGGDAASAMGTAPQGLDCHQHPRR